MPQRRYKKITDYKEMIKLLDKIEIMLAEAAYKLKDHAFWEVVEDVYEVKMQFRKNLEEQILIENEESMH